MYTTKVFYKTSNIYIECNAGDPADPKKNSIQIVQIVKKFMMQQVDDAP